MQISIDGIRLSGIAAVVPPQVVEIDSYASVFGEKKIRRIKKSSGVERVHVVAQGVTASDLSFQAAQRIMGALDIAPQDFDAIIFSSLSQDYRAPATSIIMQDRLGLPKTVVAMDLIFGCSGFVYGLYQASLLLKAGGCKRVLLLNGDTQSVLVHPQDRSMKMLVGDAGTATIVEKGSDTFNFVLGCDGSGYDHLIIPAGGCRQPVSAATHVEQSDSDGNVRTLENLRMDGMEIMKFALSAAPKAINEVLAMLGKQKDEISLYALHQPNKMILDSIAMDMDVVNGRMPCRLKNTGNTSSASIPVLLSVLADEGYDFSAIDDVIVCGFGIGLSYGAVSLKLKETRILPLIVSE